MLFGILVDIWTAAADWTRRFGFPIFVFSVARRRQLLIKRVVSRGNSSSAVGTRRQLPSKRGRPHSFSLCSLGRTFFIQLTQEEPVPLELRAGNGLLAR